MSADAKPPDPSPPPAHRPRRRYGSIASGINGRAAHDAPNATDNSPAVQQPTPESDAPDSAADRASSDE